MARIVGVERVVAVLRGKAAAARRDSGSVVVGFTSQSAIHIHENMEMKLAGQPRPSGIGVYWGPKGGPKFLEAPAREMARTLGATVQAVVAAGKTLMQGLLLAGLQLQRASQERVPVEYGALRASAFTRVEN